MGRGNDALVVVFFVVQAFGISFERLWHRVMRRKVSGWFGTVWVWVWIVGGGQWCSQCICSHLILSQFLTHAT
jgi:hypothetical protein